MKYTYMHVIDAWIKTFLTKNTKKMVSNDLEMKNHQNSW
jgi:hypothetical protein